MKSYLKMDFYRMLTSKYFGIGILGVVGVYGLSLMQLKSQDVYLLNYYIKFYSTYMVLLIFGAVAYSNAMMEDLEYKNYYLQIQKGSFRKYIWSKVITAFISAVIVMVLGTSIFCLMAHFKMPLLSPDNDMLEYLADGDYLSQLITPETIFWYLIADAAMTGLMAGIFSVFAMWLSLFVKNQMFTVMVPIVGFYFFVNYFTRIFGENDYFKLNVIYISNGKIFLIAIIWLFILDVYLADYRSMAMTLGLKDSFAILPHVQNDFYFNKIMLLGGMIFFADIPFMSGEELYVVLKIGKEKWSQINCCYIVLSGVLLSTLLTVLSLLTILPAISLKNEWGTLYQTFAFSGTADCVIINSKAMSYYSPYALMLNIFLIDALTFAFMGMLLYTLSLFVSKIWSYVIVVVLIFLQSVFGKMGLVLDNFLPFSWISASHWRFGYDRHRPDLIYIYTAFCMLLFLLAVISEWKIKRMDWVSKEEHR